MKDLFGFGFGKEPTVSVTVEVRARPCIRVRICVIARSMCELVFGVRRGLARCCNKNELMRG